MPTLITIADASRMSERDASTIRRWIRKGHLVAHEGPIPASGGKASTLIDHAQLQMYLVTSGAQPRLSTESSNEHEVLGTTEHARANDTHQPIETVTSAQIEAAELRGKLIAANALGDVGRLNAELVAATQTLTLTQNALADMRADRDDWRERHDAREAELRALRALQGGSWWQKLLGGPVAPAIEAK